MRVTIPKRLRDELKWTPGDMLEVVLDGKEIVISRCES